MHTGRNLAWMLAALVVLVAGCDKRPAAAALPGTWVVDADRTRAAYRAALDRAPAMTPGQRDEALKSMDAIAARTAGSPMHFAFNADGTLTGVGPTGQKSSGTWTLDEQTGVVSLRPDEENQPGFTARLKGEELHLEQQGVTFLVFVKGTPKGL